jgi:formylglycine-generating enzyme required for sulfatase activity
MRSRFFIGAAAVAVMLVPGFSKSPTVTKNNTTKANGMVSIPGGTFQMGGTLDNSEQPVHSVMVSAFYMDATDVTQGSFRQLMGYNPSFCTGNRMRPVEMVTWFDAALYCNARSRHEGKDTVYSYSSVTRNSQRCTGLAGVTADFSKNGYRLPTEAEWEYACRAGSATDYYWGRNCPPSSPADTLAIDSNVVWWHDNAPNGTQPVATRKPNAWGLYDMIGNVSQWCNDWFGSYSGGDQIDPTGPSTGKFRVLRGGSWRENDIPLRAAYRNNNFPNNMNHFYGFRCVRRR